MGSEGKSVPLGDAHTSGDVPPSPQPTLPGLSTPRKVQRVIQWDNDYYGHWKWGEGGEGFAVGCPRASYPARGF